MKEDAVAVRSTASMDAFQLTMKQILEVAPRPGVTWGFDGYPTTVYTRSQDAAVSEVRAVLGASGGASPSRRRPNLPRLAALR